MKTIIYRCDECHQAEIIDLPANYHQPISPLTTIKGKEYCERCIDHIISLSKKQQQ